MSEAKATKEATNVITNEKGLVYKPDENKLVVYGTLVNFRHSTTKYSGAQEFYQVSVKTESLTPEVVAEVKKKYFSDTKDKYLPSFIKDMEETGGKDAIYVNLKSQYEIATFMEGDGNKRYSMDDVIELGEGLPPLGSIVKLSIRLKENSAYPLAVMIVKLQKQDASDYFD